MSRRQRATTEQLNAMVDFMLKNPGMANGQFRRLHGKVADDQKWDELAEILNRCGGAVKDLQQWHSVWKDLKSRTKVKFCRRRTHQAERSSIKNLRTIELQKRMISLIQQEDSHVENEPLKEELLLHEDNGDSSFSDLPSISSVSDTEFHLKAIQNSPEQTTEPVSPKPNHLEDENSDMQLKFLEIAETQAHALKMLAETSAASVEIARTQAGALKILAQCSAESVEANNKMADAIKTLGEGLKHIADSFNLL